MGVCKVGTATMTSMCGRTHHGPSLLPKQHVPVPVPLLLSKGWLASHTALMRLDGNEKAFDTNSNSNSVWIQVEQSSTLIITEAQKMIKATSCSEWNVAYT